MKIALLGYGKMGKAIELEAKARGHQIVERIELDNHHLLAAITPQNTDVIIEFTHPDSFWVNMKTIFPLAVPIVSGTTGWHDRKSELAQLVSQHQAGFMYSSNFSIGVNILFMLNQKLAQLMNDYPEYDCFIEEQHHRFKADAPSGTAVTLGQQIIEHLDRKQTIATDDLLHRAPKEGELSIGYIRSGEIKGRHKVSYTTEIDTISIEHQAHSRRGFALGAVVAAEWMKGKRGFYNFSDIFIS